MLTIERRSNGRFALVDDGQVYDTYATSEEAEHNRNTLEREVAITRWIKAQLELLADRLAETYLMTKSDAAKRIREEVL